MYPWNRSSYSKPEREMVDHSDRECASEEVSRRLDQLSCHAVESSHLGTWFEAARYCWPNPHRPRMQGQSCIWREKFPLPLEAVNTLPRGRVWIGKEERGVNECVGLQSGKWLQSNPYDAVCHLEQEAWSAWAQGSSVSEGVLSIHKEPDTIVSRTKAMSFSPT